MKDGARIPAPAHVTGPGLQQENHALSLPEGKSPREPLAELLTPNTNTGLLRNQNWVRSSVPGEVLMRPGVSAVTLGPLASVHTGVKPGACQDISTVLPDSPASRILAKHCA